MKYNLNTISHVSFQLLWVSKYIKNKYNLKKKKMRECMNVWQVNSFIVFNIFFFRMDQACGVHTWVRQHPPVPQSALGDLWGDRVEHPGHRRAPDRPHWEGLRQRQLLWQISATAVWWALVYRWKHVNIQSAGSFYFINSLCALHQVPWGVK